MEDTGITNRRSRVQAAVNAAAKFVSFSDRVLPSHDGLMLFVKSSYRAIYLAHFVYI